jgi:hypothetical protein
MSTVLFRFERHIGDLIRKVEIETDFLPKVGDSVNAYNIFDDVKVEPGGDGWFFMVYEIRWSVEGNHLMPTVHLMSSKYADRKRLLAVDRGQTLEGTA